MNARCIVPGVVIALLFALPARAQQTDPTATSSNPLANTYGSPFRMPLGPGLEDPPQTPVDNRQTTSLSPYILGANSHPDGCCGPIGAHGPIGYDIYLRNGIGFSFGNPFAGDLSPGWAVQGGARALFFDTAVESAWVVDFSITNIYQAVAGEKTYRLVDFPERGANNQINILPEKFLTGDEYNRTMVGLSIGREHWLIGDGRHVVDGCATCPEACGTACYWRAGWDVGGRWGSSKYQPNEARHLTAVIGSVYVAAHTDLEIPCGFCIFQTGFRLEWGYTWNDILQSRNRADVQDILLMWNLGLRF